MEDKPTFSPPDADSILSRLISLEGSTTYFLENLSNQTINVEIQSQTKEYQMGQLILKRAVMMHSFGSISPALFCRSEMAVDALEENEIDMLLNTSLPIGKVFKILNKGHVIRKEDIKVESNVYTELQSKMQLSSPLIYSKSYQFFVGDRNVGVITEYFNQESLLRLWNI